MKKKLKLKKIKVAKLSTSKLHQTELKNVKGGDGCAFSVVTIETEGGGLGGTYGYVTSCALNDYTECITRGS
ncbi:TIGR04149 family rSAM-modified RiPP [uncultured Chryseobacterium sp.]|uniref:TIGR04149 family rSAM-modified RiPP n=1 Tax=uncultured Chryseobacterium sp. TaxID=259322 RepID=UPI0025F2CA69|nr:TIGR04149 family rSAM-modified RiPP [uncultured Chryseobacterium sp.]